MTIPAAIYARYSSDNQREESIDAQIRAINEYAKKEGYVIVKIYCDEAKSATTDKRPQFLQMIKDSKLGLFKVVIVHKLDRFSRDRYDSAFYKRELRKNGVRLISVLEHLDDSPESILLESVIEGVAEYYSRNLAREVMKGMKETALQCKHNGGKPPFGYDVATDKSYIINDSEARVIKQIFEMYAAGNSYNNIIDTLQSQGVKTKTGSSFGKNSLHDLLRNEKYTGIYIFNRTIRKTEGKRNNHKSKPEEEIIKIPGGMPAIISKELWEAVSNKMDGNKKARAANSAKEIYLLSGLIYCGKCGGAMNGKRRHAGRDKTLYASYECATKKRLRTCDMKEIGKEFVEKVVIDQLYADIFAPASMEKLANKIEQHTKEQAKEIASDIVILEKDLKSVLSDINNIVEAIAKGMFHESMKEKLDDLEARKSILKIRLEEAKHQAVVHAPTLEMIYAYLQKDADIKEKSPEDQKKVIQAFVKKIKVLEDKIDTEIIVTFDGGDEPHCDKRKILSTYWELTYSR